MQKTLAGRVPAECASDADEPASPAAIRGPGPAAKRRRRSPLSGALRVAVTGWACLGLSQAALAQTQEQINYQYDALGRLKNVAYSGPVNNGATTIYTLDAAGNRTNVSVTTPAAALSLSIGDTSTNEGNDLVFTVTLTGTATGTVTVNYAATNGTATSGSFDFYPVSGTLTFTAGQTVQTVRVPTFVDHSTEGNETMFVDLSAPSGNATITRSRATGTIIDTP